MEILTANPFWLRMGLSPRVALAWTGGAAILGGVVGALAAAAQHTAQASARSQGLSGVSTYSLAAHVLSMVLLGALAVAVSVTLVRSGSHAFAGLVLIAVAIGPMTLVATPVRAGLVAESDMDTRPWWHVVVAAMVVAVLVGWTAAAAHAQPVRSRRVRIPYEGGVLTVLVAVGFTVCWNKSFDPLESVGVLPSAGWAVLAVGLATAVAHQAQRAAIAPFLLASATLLSMYGAYHREGGWPGVAGWELDGMESPVVASPAVAIMVLLALPVGLGLGWVRHRCADSVPDRRPVGTATATT